MESLKSLSIDYLVKNLYYYQNDFDSSIKLLPPHIKDQLLHRFTCFPLFWKNVNFKEVLKTLIHTNTQHIDLCLASVDDEILNILKISNNLQFIRLSGNLEDSLSSEALLSLIPYLKSLYVLQVPNCSAVNDDVIISIAYNCPRLAGIDVDGCVNVSDLALEAMSTLENLKWIKLSGTRITTMGVEKLITGASGIKLKELRLANCQLLTSAVLNIIVQYCPNIEILVFYNTPMNEEDLENICFTKEGPLKNLKQLTWTVH